MKFNPPARIRAIIYIVTAFGAPLVAYLLAKGVIGELELNLYAGIVTAVNVMAGLNTANPTPKG